MPKDEQLSSLAERHRPRRFSEVIGRRAEAAYLERQARQRTGRSVLLYGPSGCGKTVLAEIYANALLCQNGGGEPCLRADCLDCSECLRRRHPNWRGLRDGTVDDLAFARAINADVDTESFGGGWLVIIFDQAHRLSERAFDMLHDRMERPPPKVTFVLCTTAVDEIPERAQSLFRLLEIGPVSVPSRIEMLRKICQKESFAYDESALELLARRSSGNLRRLVQDLEAVAEVGTLTVNGVREFCRSDGGREIARYVEVLLSEGPLERQMGVLDAWLAPPERKISGIEAYFAEIFSSSLRIGPRGVILELAEVADRARIVQSLTERGERLGMSPRHFFHEILRFWVSVGGESDAMLLRKVSEFDELLNGPAGARSPEAAPQLVPPRRKLPRVVHSLAVGAENSRLSSHGPRTPPMGAGYLSLKQVRALWDAASFLIQMHGLFLNTRISIRYARLGFNDPAAIGPFLTSLLHELRMVVNGRAAKRERREPFHWLFVHEHAADGARTHVAATIPKEAGDIEAWLREQFLPHNIKGSCLPEAVIVRRAESPNDQQFARHLQLLRLLCRGLDPTYTIQSRDPNGGMTDIALIERLGVPRRLRDQIGRPFGAQRYSVSRLIGPDAQRKARNDDLAPLSAFRQQAWLAVDSGWEITEHEYREKLKMERAAAEAELDRAWPAQGSDFALKRRAAEFDRFKQAWLDTAEARERTRPGLSRS